MNYLVILFLTISIASAEGFLQNMTDKYFEQGKYENKKIKQPTSPTKPKVTTPKIKLPKSPDVVQLEKKESSSSSATSLQNFTDRLFSQGKYKKDDKEELDKHDNNTTKFQNFVDKLLKQNSYKEK